MPNEIPTLKFNESQGKLEFIVEGKSTTVDGVQTENAKEYEFSLLAQTPALFNINRKTLLDVLMKIDGSLDINLIP
jgi:hypothetical protein